MEKKDVLLLALSFARKPVTPVQLQKSLFLISEADLDDVSPPLYQFQPMGYGSYCEDIYCDVRELVKDGLIIHFLSNEGSWRETLISRDGAERAYSLKEQLPIKVVDYIEAVMRWVQDLSFSDLVKSIYAHYPEYRVNGVFQN